MACGGWAVVTRLPLVLVSLSVVVVLVPLSGQMAAPGQVFVLCSWAPLKGGEASVVDAELEFDLVFWAVSASRASRSARAAGVSSTSSSSSVAWAVLISGLPLQWVPLSVVVVLVPLSVVAAPGR